MEQLAPVWESFPSLARLATRPELHRLLLKPKILDLFASQTVTQDPTPEKWTGESDLIQWFWNDYVKSGPSSHVRDGFIKLLAGRQADRCDPEVPSDTFAPSDLGPLDGLIQDRICIATEERYKFEHNLYGDWARQRILLGRRRDLAQFVQERLNSPFWHRPLRLLGVHLLEQESADSWREAYDQVSARTDEGTLAGDLLLESVIFAANPLPLLETMWDVLRADKGLLLNRLLGRFLHVATYPNELVVRISGALGFSDKSGPATRDRIPIPVYWPPMVEFLRHHMSEVIEIVPLQAAKVCERWLSEGPLDAPTRKAAVELALEMAENRLALKMVFWRGNNDDELDRILFKAALESLDSLPERTRDFALTACGRKQPSGRTLEMIQRLQESTGGKSYQRKYTPDWIELSQRKDWPHDQSESKFLDPWPDGPMRTVNRILAETSLATNALTPIMIHEPALATEIILASLIAAPCQAAYLRSYAGTPENELGLAEADRHFYPPFWSRTPFLPFLMVNPSAGIDLIIRLVDFCTDRWEERSAVKGESCPTVTLDLSEGARQFIGDSYVYRWYRGLGNAPNVVATALMALENWLYYQLDQGLCVSTPIMQILAKSRSVAFLGLLCCVGKRNPKLFETELRPLLGVPELYLWDIDQSVEKDATMIPWAFSNPHLKRLAYQWHELPHRGYDLRQIAFNLFLESEQMRLFFNEVRLNWSAREKEEQQTGHNSHFIRNLSAIFNPANLIAAGDDDGNTHVFTRSESPAYDKAYVSDQQAKKLLMAWPFHLWKVLIGEETLSEQELEGFWDQVSGMSNLIPPRDFDLLTFKIENCLAGGAAVLLKHHRQWLKSHRDYEEWCISTLLDLVLNPPDPSPMDSAIAHQEGRWLGFCSAILPMLLVEQPDSDKVRQAVAILVTDSHYGAIRIFFEFAASIRTQLADDFMRLQNLVLRWAAARWVQMCANVFEAVVPNFETWRNAEIEQFVSKTTPPAVPDWQIIRESVNGYLTIEFDDRNERSEIFRKFPGVDVHIIMNAYAWATNPEDAVGQKELHERVRVYEQALECTLAMFSELQESPNHKEFIDDYEWIQWLFGGLSRVIPAMREDEHPERFWQPILQLGVNGAEWIKLFFSSWFMENLTRPRLPDGFVTEWNRMIDFVIQSDRWSFDQVELGYYDLSGMWCNLMGFGAHWVGLWATDRRPIVDLMRDRYEAWASVHLERSRCAESFAEFLRQPAAEGLRCDAVVWLAHAADQVGSRYFTHSGVEGSVVSFLDLCWTSHSRRIRGNTEAFESFRRLLRTLAGRQNATAMEILQRIAVET